MSMNLFFRTFTPQELEAMDKDHGLIEKWTWEEEKFSASTDVETAWDVLQTILRGTGFQATTEAFDTLSNGCSLVPPGLVKNQAQKLSGWTHEKVLEGLQQLDENADLYRLECYRDEPDDLLEQFDKLVGFYREASEKGLGAIYYAA